MGNAFIAFVAGAAAGGWIYTKFARSTGGNAKSSATAATVVGLLIFIAAYAGLRAIS